MKGTIFCFALLLGTLPACSQKSKEKTAAARKLVWSDEFDYTGLPNPAKWDYEEGLVRNQEPQYYTKNNLQNCRVENGVLVNRSPKTDRAKQCLCRRFNSTTTKRLAGILHLRQH